MSHSHVKFKKASPGPFGVSLEAMLDAFSQSKAPTSKSVFTTTTLPSLEQIAVPTKKKSTLEKLRSLFKSENKAELQVIKKEEVLNRLKS